MSIAHGAQHASPTILLPIEDTYNADGEPIGEGFEHIGERLTVLAVAAGIMMRRHPGDVYARSIARETLRLAGAMREALHTDGTEDTVHPSAPVIDTTLATPATPETPDAPASAPSATHETPATPATHHRARGSARASTLMSSSSKRKGGAV